MLPMLAMLPMLSMLRYVKGGGLLYGGYNSRPPPLTLFFSIETPLSANDFLFVDRVSANKKLFADTIYANKNLFADSGVPGGYLH